MTKLLGILYSFLEVYINKPIGFLYSFHCIATLRSHMT